MLNLPSLLNRHPAFLDSLSGFQLCIASVLLDWSILLLTVLPHVIRSHGAKRALAALEKELQTVDMKEEFPRYARLTRNIKDRQKSMEFKVPWFIKWGRTLIVAILLFRKSVCSFPAGFWGPMQWMVSFPHPRGDLEPKVGFVFFWLALTKADGFLLKLLTDVDI
jgi:hypothetical protein